MNVSVDNERMRNRPQFRYEIIERTTHYRIIDGRTYRDCVARRLSDGAMRLIGVPA
jgi:hypothetical protein